MAERRRSPSDHGWRAHSDRSTAATAGHGRQSRLADVRDQLAGPDVERLRERPPVRDAADLTALPPAEEPAARVLLPVSGLSSDRSAAAGVPVTGPGQNADATLPPADRQAAVEQIEKFAQGARGVEELLASITGRWPQVRLLHRYQLGQVEDPPRALLDTTGPVLGRSLELLDPGAGSGPDQAAISTELIVVHRLPATVAAELATAGDPLDRILDRLAVDWDSELIRTLLIPDRVASVQVLRRIWAGADIVALLSEQYPLYQSFPADHRAAAAAAADTAADAADPEP